ncbi:hypothetical protein LTR97_006807 [Elasticomyces elasticus]|uniref:F-box domain-containing protein n=1 Tax=Elasticomyces elasticus TaxID=574655 RepID=A0AAN7ZTI2_9PEZI|nr:hypothetical protein LTR97_006807 [Elasticomyces elasticus]
MAGSKRRRDDDVFKPSREPRTHEPNLSAARRATRLTTKHSAFNAVLLTTELLEHILSQLPMKDLLLAQRVSRKWRDVIAQSKELQQQLFMLPIEAELVWDRSFTEDGEWSELTRFRGDKSYRRPGDYEHTFKSGDINELLLIVDDYQDIWDKTSEGSASEYAKFRPNLPPLDNPEASWRRMLLTQPPTFDVDMCCTAKNGEDMDTWGFYPNGVRMGDVVKPIEEGAAVGKEWDHDMHHLAIRGFAVLSEDDREMEVIHEGEWYVRHYGKCFT